MAIGAGYLAGHSVGSGRYSRVGGHCSIAQNQAYERWRLCAVADGASAEIIEVYCEAARNDPRLLKIEGTKASATFAAGVNNSDCVAIIEPGDTLPEYALALVAEQFAAKPNLVTIYGDEDAVTRDGTLHSPVLKPHRAQS